MHHNLLIDERTGEVTFRDFTRDDKQMARLFEKFLFRFYEREQDLFKVDAPRLQWSATGERESLEYLPAMRTDIVVRNAERTIVIDAKYYAETLSEYFGKSTVRSEHLYQLFSYLSHMPADGRQVEGMLIYPRTTKSVSIRVGLFGHPVQVATINLAQSRGGIHRDLLALL